MNRLFFCTLFALLLGSRDLAARQYERLPASDEGADETVVAPPGDADTEAKPARSATVTESLPYTPYPAGLSWVLTPQAFRVPIPNRIYYPPQHYVRRCPYYPRGYYWGANWRFNV